MAPPKQAYDVMRAIMDSLGTLYLNAQTSKEASAIKREDWNKKVYLTNMDHENSLDRIETTSRLNTLSKEIDNQTLMVRNRLKTFKDWGVTIEDQSTFDELNVSPEFGELTSKLKEDAGNKLFISIEDFKEGITEYDKQRYKLQHLASVDKVLKILEGRATKVLNQSMIVDKKAGDDLLDNVHDISDHIETAKELGYDMDSFDWNVFMSDAPTHKETDAALKALQSIKTSKQQEEYYKTRNKIEQFNLDVLKSSPSTVDYNVVGNKMSGFMQGYKQVGQKNIPEDALKVMPYANLGSETYKKDAFGPDNLFDIVNKSEANLRSLLVWSESGLKDERLDKIYKELVGDAPDATDLKNRTSSGALRQGLIDNFDFSEAPFPFNTNADNPDFNAIVSRMIQELETNRYARNWIRSLGLVLPVNTPGKNEQTPGALGGAIYDDFFAHPGGLRIPF